ncbi:hypothetical protein ACHQM5_017826 [Ranunculus cassubicifolius]
MQIPCIVIFCLWVVSAADAIEPPADQSVCQETCGNISIPYPFGLGNSPKCFKARNFRLDCNDSRLFVGNIPIVDISLKDGTVMVGVYIAFICNNIPGRTYDPLKYDPRVSLGDSPFVFSNTENRFTAIGCNTDARISDGDDATGRFTRIGCCQTPIPPGLKILNISLSLYGDFNESDWMMPNSNPCTYGFLSGSNFTLVKLPSENYLRSLVVLDWAIGDMTCNQARNSASQSDDVCGANTNCIDSSNGPGYRCSCKDGFEGNPYTKVGCTDIDECLPRDGHTYPCAGSCKNTDGDYTCDCPFGYQGDGKVSCRMKTIIKVLIAIGSLVLFVCSVLFTSWLYKRRLQASNHRKNGGSLLGQLTVKSYKETQLEKATNGFDSKNLLGEGGNGWVYRGLLADTVHIAVKKSKVVDQEQIEQFLNEADIVSQINHKNVVKLLGLCLDSRVPMLVYEFVPNGTLYQHLHGTKSRILDSWRICLRVAAETARALDYMHSQADPPIIHRDVKSSNILLDGTYTAKVADFGASMLIRLDRAISPAQGQGTLGYLDPEYLQTGELTTMSDVYGFGVVLMELLSKQKPITQGSSGEMIALVKIFASAVSNNNLDQVVKVAEVNEHETDQVHLVAKLATRCVAMPSTTRPTMSEMADVLNGMSKEYSSFSVEGGGDEVVGLLDDQDIMTTSVHFELEYSSSV